MKHLEIVYLSKMKGVEVNCSWKRTLRFNKRAFLFDKVHFVNPEWEV